MRLATPLLVLPLAVLPAQAERLDGLRTRVIPNEESPWQTIPWRINLDAARAEATASGKPLFLWTMNGHPLGCT